MAGAVSTSVSTSSLDGHRRRMLDDESPAVLAVDDMTSDDRLLGLQFDPLGASDNQRSASLINMDTVTDMPTNQFDDPRVQSSVEMTSGLDPISKVDSDPAQSATATIEPTTDIYRSGRVEMRPTGTDFHRSVNNVVAAASFDPLRKSDGGPAESSLPIDLGSDFDPLRKANSEPQKLLDVGATNAAAATLTHDLDPLRKVASGPVLTGRPGSDDARDLALPAARVGRSAMQLCPPARTDREEGRGSGSKGSVPQRMRRKESIKFIVTRVEDNDDGSTSDMDTDAIVPSRRHGNGSVTSPHGMVTLQVLDGGTSDAESSYGDTLTQTSITKLLSAKFKETYRTYRNRRERSRSPGRELRPSEPSPLKRITAKYESQDYDQCENSLFMKEKEAEKSQKLRRKWFARWVVNCLVGIGTAVVATFIEYFIEVITKYKFLSLTKLVDHCDGEKHSACMLLPLMAWLAINCSLVFIGSGIVTFIEPNAVGSGIPQIKCYLNGVKIPGLLGLKTLFAKVVGVILSVAGGLACGKEGPMIHSGAIVAAGISQGRSKICNVDFKIFEYLRSDNERRDFVSGGAAAGVAAAFGAPVGGVLFSLEEGASFWNQSLTWRIVFASMMATFTVNILLSAINGHPSDLSNPGLISFGRFPSITYQAVEIPIFLLMAVIGGLLGALFNDLNRRLTLLRKRFICSKWAKVTEAVVVAGASAIMGFMMIYFVSDCVPTPKDDKHHGHVQFACPKGHHNVMSSLFFKTPEESLITTLHSPEGSYTVLTLSLFATLYFLLSCLTYGLSVSSGVFIPALLSGAAWGRLVGMAAMYVFPQVGYDYARHSKLAQANNIGKYALIGAACQLGGIVRMTISLTVILIECTGDITFGLPIVMVLTIAKWVGDFFNTGLYDLHIQMMGIPLLPWEPPEMAYDITAKQVMNSPVHTLRCQEKVRRVYEVLEKVPHVHSGFPVVCSEQSSVGEEEFGLCRGLILRSQLLLLLKNKVFVDESNNATLSTMDSPLKLEDFRDAYHKDCRKTSVKPSETDMELFMDLEPYMNPTPYTVTKNTSLPRMFRLFRGLGLRHLIVVNHCHQVVGMVTRKDLAKYRLMAKGVKIKMQELLIR